MPVCEPLEGEGPFSSSEPRGPSTACRAAMPCALVPSSDMHPGFGAEVPRAQVETGSGGYEGARDPRTPQGPHQPYLMGNGPRENHQPQRLHTGHGVRACHRQAKTEANRRVTGRASVPGSRNSGLEKQRGRQWGWPPAPLRQVPALLIGVPCASQSAMALTSSSDGPPPTPAPYPRPRCLSPRAFLGPWPSGGPYEQKWGLRLLQHPLTLSSPHDTAS